MLRYVAGFYKSAVLHLPVMPLQDADAFVLMGVSGSVGQWIAHPAFQYLFPYFALTTRGACVW